MADCRAACYVLFDSACKLPFTHSVAFLADSLGFATCNAGLPRADGQQETGAGARERIVTFGGVSFAPTPTAATPPAAKAATPVPAAAGGAASSGWGDAFLAANKGKAAAAAEAAAAEAEGGNKLAAAQPVQPASGFTFGLPAAQPVAFGDTPSAKQRSGAAAAELPAAAAPPAQPALFGFKPAEPTDARAASQTAITTQADAAAAPKFAFGGSSSSNGIASKVAAVVSGAPANVNGPVPTFLFGGKKAGGKESKAAAGWTSPAVRGTLEYMLHGKAASRPCAPAVPGPVRVLDGPPGPVTICSVTKGQRLQA